ncbi:Nif3-like dinuclear metal center hexameric protein [Roseateles koreensis]|uniref:Nif3-like dinuclear metal center hexameric protein n=1 Tax=Roseateles koreensis TaxID=2987526 RepID=A0ABT5KSN3_9BURK|nr:Nif3-like dinuclear metal center hexameric protein [Roseateles koreensis]MDC8785862.1 Nif3-like dinuclear metal center hexameric protein [Roseateles koreensis]
MIHRNVVERHLARLLETARFKDYGPNGLQVEGREGIGHLVCGVTASLAFIDAAIAAKADAVLVHHGLFWRGQEGRVTGWLKRRLARLLAHDINVLAYHLPLDAHPELGNNAQLGRLMGWQTDARFGEQALGSVGALTADSSCLSLDALAQQLGHTLGREPVLARGDGRDLRRVAWCTGGAQSYFEEAIAAGADVFVTGEISEAQAHYAAESGVAYIAAGHHATERYGVQALAQHLAEEFGITQQFIDIPNPA